MSLFGGVTVKKVSFRLLSVFLAVLVFIGISATTALAAVESPDFLRTEGERIVNESGETIVLRGTNFGGWGILEDWFCPFSDPSGEENVYQTLVDRFGQDATHALFQSYRKN